MANSCPVFTQERRDESESGGKVACAGTAAMTGQAVSRGCLLTSLPPSPFSLVRTAAMDFTIPYSEPSGPN